MLQIGQHEGFESKGGLTRTVLNTKNGVLQFFLGPKLQYARAILSEEDLNTAIQLAKRRNMKVFSHAPYLWNFAGTSKKVAWKGDEDVDKKMKFLIGCVEHELATLSHFRRESLGGGVVIHPGTFKIKGECLKAINTTLKKINYPKDSLLLLENCAGKGTTEPRNFDEMAILLEGLPEDNVGVCLDTAHIFGIGNYDLSNISEIDRMKKEFDEKIGLRRLKLIHLNDSQVPFGSNKDRHDHPGEGLIWRNNLNSLRHFLNEFKEYPMIVEVGNAKIEFIQSLYKQI